jgi:hypothetical protein
VARAAPGETIPVAEVGAPRWLAGLGHPAVGNLLAFLALLVAVGAALGFLQQPLFWLLLSYVGLAGALLVAIVIARRRESALRSMRNERDRLVPELRDKTADITRYDRALADAREDAAGCEAGYAQLRGAVLQAARVTDGDYEEFDDELADAIRRLAKSARR